VRLGRPWTRVKGNWGCIATAPALLLFSNQRQLEVAHTSRPESGKLSSPSLFIFFLLHQPSLSLAQGYSTTRSDDSCGSSRHHGNMTPQATRAPLGSTGAGSSKRVTAWAQAPPRRRQRGLGSRPDGSRSRLRSFFKKKLIFDTD
jgi:hypothetical protein